MSGADILVQALEREAELEGWSGREFPFRVWWVRDYSADSIGGWWRWLTERETWNPTGGMPEWLYRAPGT